MVTRKVVRWWWLVLLFLVACAPTTAFEPAATGIVIEVATASALSSVTPPAPPPASPTPESYPHRGLVWPTSTRQPGPYPPPTATDEPEIVEPTETPEPTATPQPTRTPTPVVTPIPTAVPPIIPLPTDATPEPFTLYYRDGDVIRSLSSTGEEDAAVFVDPVAEFGLYLAPEYAPHQFRDWGDISPDGTLVALALAEVPESADPNYMGYSTNVYLLDQKSRELQLLAEDAAQPVWSPDGRYLAYLSSADWSLWVADIANGEKATLYTPDRVDGNFHEVRGHAWATDSRRMALIDELPEQEYALIVVDVEKPDDVVNLTGFTPYPPGNPQWSPTDDAIAFTSYAGEGENGPHLWTVNPETGEQRQLSRTIRILVGTPRWSPDGQWIAISGPMPFENDNTIYDLWLLHRTGDDLRRLTAAAETADANVQTDNLHPTWSPFGTQAVYLVAGTEEDRREIWLMSLIDGSQRQLGVMGIPFDNDLSIKNW